MPELPEVEITARRLRRALEGAEVESALAPGMATLKTFEPPLDALDRRADRGRAADRQDARRRLRRRATGEPLTLLIHLMSAGRLQLFDKRASLKDRRSRLLVRLADGRELRLREFGTKQRGLGEAAAAGERRRGRDGRDARPRGLAGARRWTSSPSAIDQPRHLHPLLRDQRDDRRDRPLLGRRDPLGGAAVALQEGLGAAAARRSSACTTRSASSATRSTTTRR